MTNYCYSLFLFATGISLALCSCISFLVWQFFLSSQIKYFFCLFLNAIVDSTFSYVYKDRLQILLDVKASLSELIHKIHWYDQCNQYSINLLPQSCWYGYILWCNVIAQKMKFSIKDFFNKCDQIRSFLRILSHLLKKSLMENFIFLCNGTYGLYHYDTFLTRSWKSFSY